MPLLETDSEICRLINLHLIESSEALEAVRVGYFDDDTPKVFTKKEAAAANKKLDDALAAIMQLKQFIREHGE